MKVIKGKLIGLIGRAIVHAASDMSSRHSNECDASGEFVVTVPATEKYLAVTLENGEVKRVKIHGKRIDIEYNALEASGEELDLEPTAEPKRATTRSKKAAATKAVTKKTKK